MSDCGAPVLERASVSTVARVLIVDGNDHDRETLAELLAQGALDVTAISSAREAEIYLDAPADLDVVILDAALPDTDGMALVRRISREGAAIFVLSDSADDGLAELAYANGAADFSRKPVARGEWLARLRKIIDDRRPNEAALPASGRVALDRVERRCTVDGQTFPLTRHERNFLACLIDSPRGFATYAQLIAAVWGDGRAVETQYLRVLAAQVRRKLNDGRGVNALIQTVAGEGFKISM